MIMEASRKFKGVAVAAAVVAGAGTALLGCGGAASQGAANRPQQVTVKEFNAWATEWRNHPTVKALVVDEMGVRNLAATDRMARDLEKIRDKAPDAPYANKELDKTLESAAVAMRYPGQHFNDRDLAAAQRRFADLSSRAAADAKAFQDKIEAKFGPSVVNPLTASDSWGQGQRNSQ
ncbi:hypothetical protein QFZ22_000051 [Streptomyces canus]|uniref:Lipoprotein n=1 Tax=Streptomyces canus TaxID=58343 RepID=A0AAW8F200_9ACTN|nr:hypothetical protein [Streptomyces canus]MDQ0904066.1 hypothetical protein [Streptomyces canus]